MKTYYDILEISRYASKEVLERAHKVLVKKYHPDLEQDKEKKAINEEHIKKINEAYEVLSDDDKRKKYDIKVFGTSNETHDAAKDSENIVDEKQANEMQEQRTDDMYREAVEKEIEEAQARIENQEKAIKENLKHYEREYLRALGYNVKEPRNWKAILITFGIIIILLTLTFLIYLIPSVKIKVDLEISQKTPIGIFYAILKAIYSGIGMIFTAIFKK